MHDAVHARFAKTAERVAARQDANAERLAERVRSLLHTTGDERALDVGTLEFGPGHDLPYALFLPSYTTKLSVSAVPAQPAGRAPLWRVLVLDHPDHQA